MVDGVLRSPAALADAGLIEPETVESLKPVSELYAVGVPGGWRDRLAAEAPDGPLARQVLPSVDELRRHPQDLSDPIADAEYEVVPGVVHRYPDRVLLKVLSACPLYCRFCFRREEVGPGGPAMGADDLDVAMAYLEASPEIFEVVLTGGDPLMLSARRMGHLLDRLAAIPHIGLIRLHSRVPVAAPDRLDREMVAALSVPRGATLWLAVHSNHAAEWGAPERAAVGRLRQAGIPLVSQTVLLAGINDQVEILESLFRTLLRLGIKPYYLHHPDRAPGTAHFRVSLETGHRLMERLRRRLTGLGLPSYVVDTTALHERGERNGENRKGFGKVPVEALIQDKPA